MPRPAEEVDPTVARLRRLQAVVGALAEAVDLDDVAHAVLAAASTLPDVVRGGLAVSAGGGRELRFVAMHEDVVGAGRVPWCTLDASDDLPLAHVVRTQRPLWCPSLDQLAARWPGVAARQRGFGTSAFAVVPLTARGRTLGALMLCFASHRPFDDAERAFLATFAEHAGSAVRRAHAFEHQQTTAELLQRSLLPDRLPDLDGLQVAAHYEPATRAQVGGDWYDVLALPDGSAVVVIGDVMGRGVPAATVMGQVRAAVRAYALLDPAPELVLARLDLLVSSLAVPEQIVTVLVGHVDAGRTAARLASAGHLPPVLSRTGGAAAVALPVGPPLGLAQTDADRVGAEVDLRPGDVLVLCTDGVVETSRQAADDGLERLAGEVRRRAGAHPRELAPGLVRALGDGEVCDDRAVLVLAVRDASVAHSAEVELSADPVAARAARGWLLARCAEWQVPAGEADDAALCLSELVTNVVIHTGTRPRVAAVREEGRLLVSVSDGGRRGRAEQLDAGVEDIGGRGLNLVEALTSAWGVEPRADGTTVWFQLPLGADAALSRR